MLESSVEAPLQLVVYAILHGSGLHKGKQLPHIILCPGLVHGSQARLGKNKIIFLSLGYIDGALLGCGELEIFRVKKIKSRERLEPCTPHGLLYRIVYGIVPVKLYLPDKIRRKPQSLNRLG